MAATTSAFLTPSPDRLSVGDTVSFTVTDPEGNDFLVAPYTITADDIAIFIVNLDLVPLSAGITVQSGLSALPADGTSTSTITAKVQDDNAAIP